MSLAEDTILEALRKVSDPELMVNVVDLGLIYGVGLTDAEEKTNIHVWMTMTTPACPYAPELLQEVRDVLGDLPGAGAVDVELTLTPPWTPDRMSEEARDELGLF
jgi:metal-sulfur cluster biosynthetic enzyme